MKSLSHHSSSPIGYIIAAVLFVVFIFGIITTTVSAQSELKPAKGERLITIHDAGTQKGILTKAPTLRQAFAEANIRVDENDMIEPGLDEELIASTYDVNVYRARPVIIIDGNKQTKVMSAHRTPAQIVENADITLQDEDLTTVVASDNSSQYTTGMQLQIDRATEFTLVLYGKKTKAFTQKTTVGDMLAEKEITLGAKDTLSVSRDTRIKKGMVVELWRNGKQTITEDQDVEFEIEKIEDADREVGFREVKTPGVKGKKAVTYEVIMKNGKEVERKEIQSVVTKQPKKQVEIVGTKMSNSFDGSFAEALAQLRSCEGSYTSNTGNGYYGAYQFDIQTWGGYKGFPHAAAAPPDVQDEKAWETYQRRGWQPWPSCARSLGLQDIYR